LTLTYKHNNIKFRRWVSARDGGLAERMYPLRKKENTVKA